MDSIMLCYVLPLVVFFLVDFADALIRTHRAKKKKDKCINEEESWRDYMD